MPACLLVRRPPAACLPLQTSVTAVDPNPAVESYMRQAAEAAGMPPGAVTFVQGVAERLPVQDESQVRPHNRACVRACACVCACACACAYVYGGEGRGGQRGRSSAYLAPNPWGTKGSRAGQGPALGLWVWLGGRKGANSTRRLLVLNHHLARRVPPF